MVSKKKICVIGSGVVGLTTAVKLLENCQQTDVEVVRNLNNIHHAYSPVYSYTPPPGSARLYHLLTKWPKPIDH